MVMIKNIMSCSNQSGASSRNERFHCDQYSFSADAGTISEEELAFVSVPGFWKINGFYFERMQESFK